MYTLLYILSSLLLSLPTYAQFVEVAGTSGLNFTHSNSPTAAKHLIETMPGGVAAFDFDSDGLTDIFFTNGATSPGLSKSEPRFHNRLFRNNGNWKFTDVTEKAGLAGAGYSMGAATGDFDNDGHVDLFVAGVFRNILYRNRGDGTFADVTAAAGIKSDRWSVTGGWFDFDRDGLLDLFVVNYAAWTASFDKYCGDQARGIRVYCHPRFFEGVPNTLYRNKGNGQFEDISALAGLSDQTGRGMSVAFADYDQDGWVDVFVPNDKLPNFLFRNVKGKKLDETALLAGVALPDAGKAISSMGAEFRDLDNDGLPDLHVTALAGETFPFFRNEGKGQFNEATSSTKIAIRSNAYSGWSNLAADFDNDGRTDLFIACSHVNDRIADFEPLSYLQPNLFLHNEGKSFTARPVGEARAHRGAAVADFDNDGALDVVVSSLGGPAELWRNTGAGTRNWLRLEIEGTRSNRDGLGAVVRIGDQVNAMTSTSGYASSSHAGVHFGLGESAQADVEITWPSGVIQKLPGVKAGQVLRVKEPEP